MDSLPRFVPGPHNLQIKQCLQYLLIKNLIKILNYKKKKKIK